MAKKMRTCLSAAVVTTLAVVGSLVGGEPPPTGKGPRAEAREHASTDDRQYLNRLAAERGTLEQPRPARAMTRFVPVILVAYANVRPPFPRKDYEALLFGPGDGPLDRRRLTARSYFRDNSQGLLDLRGRVVGWYTAPGNDAEYQGGGRGPGATFGRLAAFALEQADKELDFGLFDNDGPDGIPNSGDDDGVADHVFLVHPGPGAECGGEAGANPWTSSQRLATPFISRDPRRNAQGEPGLAADGSPQRIRVVDLSVTPGLSCQATRAGKPKIVEIDDFCHQYGHALGLPDLYDRSGVSSGIGTFCLMSVGSYGGDGKHPERPVGLSAWCKAYLGWADVATLKDGVQVGFEPVQRANRVYRIDVPETGGKEYFLIEYRPNDWTDPFGARANWDADLPGSGLLIWHVDERVGQGSREWPSTPVEEGQNDRPSLPAGNPPRFPEKHAMVALVQADGRLDLERGRNRGDAGDYFATGSTFGDDPGLRHGSRGYDNEPTGIVVGEIDLHAQTFRFVPGHDKLKLAASVVGTDRPVATEELLRLDREAERRHRGRTPGYVPFDARPGRPDPKARAWDWRSRPGVVSPASNQQACGCCWAFVTAGAFDSAYAIRNGRPIEASKQHILNCSGAGSCDGGWWAFDFLIANGVTSALRMPYVGGKESCQQGIAAPYRASAWGYVARGPDSVPSVEALKEALCRHGPLAVAVYASPGWGDYRRGEVFFETPGAPVNKAVLLVGWDDDLAVPGDREGAWTIQNTWGDQWGDRGFMRIGYRSSSVGYGAAWVRAALPESPPDLTALRRLYPAARPFEPAAGRPGVDR